VALLYAAGSLAYVTLGDVGLEAALPAPVAQTER